MTYKLQLQLSHPNGNSLEFPFHHRAQVRITKSQRGIAEKPKAFQGAIEISAKSVVKNNLENLFHPSLIKDGFIDIKGKFNNAKIKIRAKKHLKWDLPLNSFPNRI